MPNEHAMRFFTPDLYLRFNSSDDDVALAADDEWEAAIKSYRSHLESLRGLMPPGVKKLSELCLHDASVLVRQPENLQDADLEYWRILPVLWYSGPPIATYAILTRINEELVFLQYLVCENVTEEPAPEGWRFSKRNEHWLYDEIRVSKGHFVHHVLLSTGITLTIPFVGVLITRVPVNVLQNEAMPAHSA